MDRDLLLSVASANHSVGPTMDDIEDDALGLRGEVAPEVQQRSLDSIFREIALAWRAAWDAESIRQEISFGDAHGASEPL